MSNYLPGVHLGNKDLSHSQLDSLAEITNAMHSLTPDNTAEPLWPIDWDIKAYIERLRRIITEIDLDQLVPLQKDAVKLASTWLSSGDPIILLQTSRIVFSRGDQNLANCGMVQKRVQ